MAARLGRFPGFARLAAHVTHCHTVSANVDDREHNRKAESPRTYRSRVDDEESLILAQEWHVRVAAYDNLRVRTARET
jgi:hypothetical protein